MANEEKLGTLYYEIVGKDNLTSKLEGINKKADSTVTHLGGASKKINEALSSAGNVKLNDIKVKADASQALRSFGALKQEAANTARTANQHLSAIGTSFKSIGVSVTKVTRPIAIGLGAMAAGFGALITMGVRYNAELEMMRISLDKFAGSKIAGGKLYNDLKELANRTPNVTSAIIDAGASLASAGFGSSEIPKLVKQMVDLNAASGATDEGIKSIGGALSRLKNGDPGEALERLRDFKINRKDLEAIGGLKFDKGGALVSSTDEAITAIQKVIDVKFSGLGETASKSFLGRWSTLKSKMMSRLGDVTKPIFDALSPKLGDDKAFKKLMDSAKPAFEKLSQAVVSLINTMPRLISFVSTIVDKLVLLNKLDFANLGKLGILGVLAFGPTLSGIGNILNFATGISGEGANLFGTKGKTTGILNNLRSIVTGQSGSISSANLSQANLHKSILSQAELLRSIATDPNLTFKKRPDGTTEILSDRLSDKIKRWIEQIKRANAHTERLSSGFGKLTAWLEKPIGGFGKRAAVGVADAGVDTLSNAAGTAAGMSVASASTSKGLISKLAPIGKFLAGAIGALSKAVIGLFTSTIGLAILSVAVIVASAIKLTNDIKNYNRTVKSRLEANNTTRANEGWYHQNRFIQHADVDNKATQIDNLKAIEAFNKTGKGSLTTDQKAQLLMYQRQADKQNIGKNLWERVDTQDIINQERGRIERANKQREQAKTASEALKKASAPMSAEQQTLYDNLYADAYAMDNFVGRKKVLDYKYRQQLKTINEQFKGRPELASALSRAGFAYGHEAENLKYEEKQYNLDKYRTMSSAGLGTKLSGLALGNNNGLQSSLLELKAEYDLRLKEIDATQRLTNAEKQYLTAQETAIYNNKTRLAQKEDEKRQLDKMIGKAGDQRDILSSTRYGLAGIGKDGDYRQQRLDIMNSTRQRIEEASVTFKDNPAALKMISDAANAEQDYKLKELDKNRRLSRIDSIKGSLGLTDAKIGSSSDVWNNAQIAAATISTQVGNGLGTTKNKVEEYAKEQVQKLDIMIGQFNELIKTGKVKQAQLAD